MSLELQSINSGYQKVPILFDVSLIVKEKDITVIVGPNGSGKSTILKTIMGMTNIYSGTILFNGKNIVGLSPHQITKLGIAYLPQVNNVFTNLTIKENLLMSSYILNKDEADKRRLEVLEVFPLLEDYMNKKAGILSGGQRQMLAMAMAFTRRPQIMLFDEPTGSLAPKIALEVLNTILDLRDEYDVSIVIVEQNARRALEHGDKALLLVSGRAMYEGESKELLNHKDLGKLYLGLQDIKM